MAVMLKNAAVDISNRGAPSSFYQDESKANPVYQALDLESQHFIAYMRKRQNQFYKPTTNEAYSRPSDTLFELWNKYEHRLPKIYFQQKLIEMGNFLASIKEFDLALNQCYGRYLYLLGEANVEEIHSVEEFKKSFFPDGFDAENSGFTFQALMGHCICIYQQIKERDPRLQNSASVQSCLLLLDFLRLVMRVILPRESLCWLVYNGTVHMYSIGRHLMTLGHSSKVLEYFLWACCCMDSSVPLMSVHYLSWRTTLYTAVCLAYYDCKAGDNAEGYARHALARISELSHLESMSNSEKTTEKELAFREATMKMGVMIFCRSVFETRKKPKGLLRPKTRANFKDIHTMAWPRTQSEKLMTDMFVGSAARMVCILQTLSDSNRRTLLSSPPAPDSEVEVLDVYSELFIAARELIAGGGGSAGNVKSSAISVAGMAGVIPDASLSELAKLGADGVSLDSVVKIVKYAYCYEQWDVYDQMLLMLMAAFKELNDPSFKGQEKSIEIMRAYDLVIPRTKHRRLFSGPDDDPMLKSTPHETHTQKEVSGSKAATLNDELIVLAEVLLSVVNGPFSQSEIDIDMMIDAGLVLWNRCKQVFQRYQTGSLDNLKYLQRMHNPSKWVYVLDIAHQVLGWCGMSSVDPALTAEIVLRLALVFEASAALEMPKDKKSDTPQNITNSPPKRSATSSTMLSGTASSISLYAGAREQLLQAREILELGLANVSYARRVVALSDGKSIADVSWSPELNNDFKMNATVLDECLLNQRRKSSAVIEDVEGNDAFAVWNTVRDLHLELQYMYHRVCIKLANLIPAEAQPSNETKPFKRRTCSKMALDEESRRNHSDHVESLSELMAACRSDNLTKAMLSMTRAQLTPSITSGKPSAKQTKCLQDALTYIYTAQNEEKKLFLDNQNAEKDNEKQVLHPENAHVPPPPILTSRTDTGMSFRPAEFTPVSGQKVSWYRLFCRVAGGSNVKVRLNDYNFPGTGLQVPAFNCQLKVDGLTPGEKYVFAVAAYTAEGKLIGGSVGSTTHSVLAAHPFPILLTWAYLAQISYQVGCYKISREACAVLWKHFVIVPSTPDGDTYETSLKKDFSLVLHRLNGRIVKPSSPVLLRMFLASVFIEVDIQSRENGLFCDLLCDKGPLKQHQIMRLQECEKMIVAMELSGWLNESNLSLQAIVQCYGLIAPLIYFKISSLPVIQVLERCFAVLQELPLSVRHKRQTSTNESLNHMIACISYHMAKVLRLMGHKTLANNYNEVGRKLLSLEVDTSKPDATEANIAIPAVEKGAQPLTKAEADTVTEGNDEGKKDTTQEGATEESEETVTETGALTLAALKRRRVRRPGAGGAKDDSDQPVNEELAALEAYMLRLSKHAQGEHDLTGSEDMNILHAFIAYLPSRTAYREVVKFRRRTRYLQFFVNLVQKALTEGAAENALDWCQETLVWLSKRNEGIMGTKLLGSHFPTQSAVVNNDNKYSVAMVEYMKAKEAKSSKTGQQKQTTEKASRKKKIKYKPLHVNPKMSDSQKQEREELEISAIEIISRYLPDRIRSWIRRRRLRHVCLTEAAWRGELYVVRALSQFGVFLKKLEFREKSLGNSSNHMFKAHFLDLEWFNLETAGTLVVNWEGGPSRLVTSEGARNYHVSSNSDLISNSLSHPTNLPLSGIEIAAVAATGHDVRDLLQPNQTMSGENTPRTYRSETGYQTKISPTRRAKEESPLIGHAETMEIMKKTFNSLKQAIVMAHRGRHWMLLQNACRVMWNCTHTALLRTYTSGTATVDKSSRSDVNISGVLDIKTLRSVIWIPFYIAADCVLDMFLNISQESKVSSTEGSKKRSTLAPFVSVAWSEPTDQQRGGAGLKFDSPLDDTSKLDCRWLHRIILHSLEILYYEQQWERLADIALRFNALTDDNYTDKVSPLLVQAQNKLSSKVSSLGSKPPQQHYRIAMETIHGGKIQAKDYLNLQLIINKPLEKNVEEVLQDTHSAHRLCCVPLDVKQSLSSFRAALSKSQYISRALQHSRKLMILYLAGQQNCHENDFGESVGVRSCVEFAATTAEPQPTMPPNLSQAEFSSTSEVQTTPLPKSQISVVISSYNKTIEMLLAEKQKDLAAEAMRELGNIYYHNSNRKAALKWWSDALDIIVGLKETTINWRNQYRNHSDSFSEHLLSRCGMWGCLLAASLSSNIAQYIYTSDLGKRKECCFLAGYLFKALFRASLPHPLADHDYALYEIGTDCEVHDLIPGVDLMSERFRCDGRSLVSSLRFVTEDLSRSNHDLFVLPLLVLYQYFTTSVCRDLQRAVEGRILKVNVLTNLGLFSEAVFTLMRLLHGERLPHTSDNHFRQVESRVPSFRFDSSKQILDSNNLKVLEHILDKRLSANLSTLFGSYLTCQLSVTHANLLIKIAERLPVLPLFEGIEDLPGTAIYVRPQTFSTAAPAVPSRQSFNASTTSSKHTIVTSKRDLSGTNKPGETKASNRLTDDSKVSLELVKGHLLATADQIATSISETIIENANSDKGVNMMGSAELELVVRCKQVLADVAQQRHHSVLAASTLYSAMNLMQRSSLLTDTFSLRPIEDPRQKDASPDSKKAGVIEVNDNGKFEYQSLQSTARLDTRLWLQCRLLLVQCLLGELKGLASSTDSSKETAVLSRLCDARDYCVAGIEESEESRDAELQAEFTLCIVQLDSAEGHPIKSTNQQLKTILELLTQVPQLSTKGLYIKAQTLIYTSDLACLQSTQSDILAAAQCYRDAHNLILEIFERLGHSTERWCSGDVERCTPVSPLPDVYAQHLYLLSGVKLRLGYTRLVVASIALKQGAQSEAVKEALSALGVLSTSLELCRASSYRIASQEAETLFYIGQAKHFLYKLGHFHQRSAAQSFIEAITTSFKSNHDLGLIRQAYIEIALIYLESSSRPINRSPSTSPYYISDEEVKDSETPSPTREPSTVEASETKEKSKRRRKRSPASPGRRVRKLTPEEQAAQSERAAAELAIRAATFTASAQRARSSVLPGDASVTTAPLSQRAQTVLPEFLLLDLVSSHMFAEKKKIYKDEIEEELSSLTESLNPPSIETYEDQLIKARSSASVLSWIQILGYQTRLQRLSNLCTTIAVESPSAADNEAVDSLVDNFNLSSYPVVRGAFFSSVWTLRLSYMHQFLQANLQIYNSSCIAAYPPPALSLSLPPNTPETDLKLIYKSYSSNAWYLPDDSNKLADPPTSIPFTQASVAMSKSLTNTGENEFCTQWFVPSLLQPVSNEVVETLPATADESTAAEIILLIYLINKKPDKTAVGVKRMTLEELKKLHSLLNTVKQRGELSFVEKVKKETRDPSPSDKKQKKTSRIRAPSPQVKRDEKLEELLKQGLEDIQRILNLYIVDETVAESIDPESEKIAEKQEKGEASVPKSRKQTDDCNYEFPFELNKTNLQRLEQFFDPRYGNGIKSAKMLHWFNKLFFQKD